MSRQVLIHHFGDSWPFRYGAYFLHRNTSDKSYQCTYLGALLDSEDYLIYRFTPKKCTFTDGVLSDDPTRPDQPAWFADSLPKVAYGIDESAEQLSEYLTGDDIIKRSLAYFHIGRYNGFQNLDEHPVYANRTFANRYRQQIHRLKKRSS